MADDKVFKVLLADPVGFIDVTGRGVEAEAKEFIELRGAHFHIGSVDNVKGELKPGVHFFYMPNLGSDGIGAEATEGKYDMVNLAATRVPATADFPKGGVRWGAGTNNFPENTLKAKGIPLTNVPAGNSVRTALTWTDALIAVAVELDIRKVQKRLLEDGKFSTKDIGDYPTQGLEGKKIAVLGITGNIAHEVTNISKAFRMNPVGFSRSFSPQDATDVGIEYASSMQEACKNADIVTLHFPYKAGETDDVVNYNSAFAHVKKGAVLMNFARGELVNGADLERALKEGLIGKVAVDADVFRDQDDNVLHNSPLKRYLDLQPKYKDRMLMLPHIATDTDHQTRVGLVKRGVDQTLSLLLEDRVINSAKSVGVPEGYIDGGTQKPAIGIVSGAEIQGAIALGRTDLELLREPLLKVLGGNIEPEDAVKLIRAMNAANHGPLKDVLNRVIRG